MLQEKSKHLISSRKGLDRLFFYVAFLRCKKKRQATQSYCFCAIDWGLR